VGGIGAVADGIYGLDLNVGDVDNNPDERIALAGTTGFEAPANRRADQITVDGKLLRFSDALPAGLLADPAAAPPFAASGFVLGAPDNYFGGALVAGTAFGQAAGTVAAGNFSGIVPADSVDGTYAGLDAFVLVSAANAPRFPPVAGPDGNLSAAEVMQILRSALEVANKSRAQIRRPLGSQARVTISVVDSDGAILGIVRTRDAPVFGTDVSLQKARTAAFFSRTDAGARLTAGGFGSFVTAVQGFVDPSPLGTALANGVAFSDRAGGNLARPYFPDGDNGSGLTGPLSKPFGTEWSPFNVGLQLDMVAADLLASLGAPAGTLDCNASNAAAGAGIDAARLANGIQIFPGSVPIYKGNTLAGGIGVSGDGIDQDDLIAFLGLHDAGLLLGTVNNAPPAIRADNITVTVAGTPVALRYVQCPFAPFLNSNEQNPCNGK
jgi:uncharacterized protein GlcG (DUF336 family)